jgi:RNA polymerase sigma factor (sigma-70 family)
VEKTLVASPVIDVVGGRRNLVEFAYGIGPPVGMVDLSVADALIAPDAFDISLEFLLAQAADYFTRDRRLASDADVQNCSQDAVVRVWQRLSRPNAPRVTDPRSYFNAVMRSVAVNYIRWMARLPNLCEPSALASYPEPDESSEIELNSEDFREDFCCYLISCRAYKLKRTFQAYLQTNHDARATSKLLRISEQTVKDNLKKLGPYLEKYFQSLA